MALVETHDGVLPDGCSIAFTAFVVGWPRVGVVAADIAEAELHWRKRGVLGLL